MDDALSQLTQRQCELLALVAGGTSASKELSRQVRIAPATIDNQLSRAAKILGVADRKAAGARYLELVASSHTASHVRAEELVSTAEIEPLTGAGSVRRVSRILSRMLGPPIGGARHSLRWDEVTMQILRVAFVGFISLTALVIFILAFFKTFG